MKNSYGFDRLSRDMLMLAVALGIIGLAFFGSISGFVLLFPFAERVLKSINAVSKTAE